MWVGTNCCFMSDVLMGYTVKKTMFEKYVYSTVVHLFINIQHLLTVPHFLVYQQTHKYASFCALLIIST